MARLMENIMNVFNELKSFFRYKSPHWKVNIVEKIEYNPGTSFFGQINCSRIKLGTRDFLQGDLKHLFYKIDENYPDYYVLLATYHLFILVGRGASIIKYQAPIGLIKKSNLLNIIQQSNELKLDCDEAT